MSKNKIIILILLSFFYSKKTFSQGMNYYFSSPIEFKCNDKIYFGTTKGIQEFLDDTPMENDLKIELSNKLDVLKKKKKTSQIVGFSLAGAGLGYILYANSKDKNEQGIKSSDAFTGFGIVCSGILFDMLFGNKRKDYQKFLETYNEKSKKNSIIIGASLNFSNNLNGRIVINF